MHLAGLLGTEAATALEELLEVGRPLPTWLQGNVNTTRMNELDGRDGAALLTASIANIERIPGVRLPPKEAPLKTLH